MLCYFVRDNTLEIVRISSDAAVGREPLVTRHQALTPEVSTLKRSGVRRDEALLRKVYGPRCWNWTDLAVGNSLVIAGTEYTLIDCDTCTRDWSLQAPRFISMAERDATVELEKLLANTPWYRAPSWYVELESKDVLPKIAAPPTSPLHQRIENASLEISEDTRTEAHPHSSDRHDTGELESVETWERLEDEARSLEAELAATHDAEMLWSTF